LFKLLALALLLAVVSAQAADWPQWRGPNRDGVIRESKLPAAWPAQPPAPKWQTIIGIGYSSPVVANGQLFIQGRKGGSETCLSFDAATGKPLWKIAYPSTFEPPDPTAGKGPNSTPTVDGDRVYMLGLGGMFHCLDVKTGRVLWKHDLAKEYWGVEKDDDGSDKWFPVCGASASALVDGKTVILPVGGRKAGTFVAFDRETGKIAWKTLADRSSYASPMISDIAGIRQLVGFTGVRMVGIATDDHRLLWEHPFTAQFEQTIIAPVLWKNRVIVCGEAKPTEALEIASDGVKLAKQVAWRNADLSAYLTTPVVHGDSLFGFDQRGKRLVCIDLASGKTTWSSPRIGRLFVALQVDGDRILAVSDSGELIVAGTGGTAYVEQGRWKVAEPNTIWSMPAVVGSRIYIRDKDRLTCYDLASDK
jgi:outer membrane protein assembly factor BamB